MALIITALAVLVALVLAMVMVLSMASVALASSVTTGTITIDNATANITYKAYKIFDAVLGSTGDSNTKITYKVSSSLKSTVETSNLFDLIVDSQGNYTVTAKSGTTGEQINSWLKGSDTYKTFDSTGYTATPDNQAGTATFSNLPFGYYYITSGLGTEVTIDSTMPNAHVNDKNTKTPDLDKNITGENGTDITATKSNDAAVGSIETYTVESSVFNWVYPNGVAKKAEKYTFTDTPDDIDIDADTVVVKVNDTTVYENKAAVGSSGVTVSKASTTGVLTIVIPWVSGTENNFRYNATSSDGSIPIVITYNAEILSTAITDTGDNDVVLKYTHDTDQDVTVDEKETHTTTYKFQLDKAKADYTDLVGAKFELYLGSVAAANKVNFVATTDGYRKADSNDASSDIVSEIDLTTVAKKVIKGLDKADYILVETQVPAGYNKAENQTVASTVLVPYDGTITDNSATIAGDVGVVTVVNNQGTELPSTGGIGTTLFYVAGIVLVLGAAAVILARRKAEQE